MSHVFTNIDGITVEGEIIFRSQYKITVAITAPYSGLEDSSYIPTRGFASIPYYQGHYPERNFLLEYGDTEATKILLRLYFVFKHIENEDNRNVLKRILKEIDDLHKIIDDKTKDFHAFRKDLRVKLKAGEIDNKVFQQNIGIFKKCLEKCRQECSDKEYHFRKVLPDIFSEETANRVIAILRKDDE